MERLATALNRAVNSNIVVDVFLMGCFGALAVRSASQEKHILALQADKESLAESNKSTKNTIWKSKQQLFAAASESGAAAVPPLSTLKAIYGEMVTATSPTVASAVNAEKPAAPKFIV